MGKLNTYCLLLLICIRFTTNAQFVCDNETKVLKKQKKAIKKYAEAQVKAWYTKNAFRLQLPKTLKFSKIQIKTVDDFDEGKKWDSIDSLLCITKKKELKIKALKKMSKMKLAVYDIRAYFNFANSNNQNIRSILYFRFDINGDLLVAVIREKENSPFSEKYYH